MPRGWRPFACATGAAYEAEVEQWIRVGAIGWVNDLPRATFQRRVLGMIEQGGDLVAVVAWQDIARVDLDGISLEVLAVSVDHQHGGNGVASYELVVDHLRQLERDGDHLAGLVHVDNARSKRLLDSVGWAVVSSWDEHELWVGHL
jgi:hypothetical protein